MYVLPSRTCVHAVRNDYVVMLVQLNIKSVFSLYYKGYVLIIMDNRIILVNS